MPKIIKKGTRYIGRNKKWKATVKCKKGEHTAPTDLKPWALYLKSVKRT